MVKKVIPADNQAVRPSARSLASATRIAIARSFGSLDEDEVVGGARGPVRLIGRNVHTVQSHGSLLFRFRMIDKCRQRNHFRFSVHYRTVPVSPSVPSGVHTQVCVCVAVGDCIRIKYVHR